jgi:HAD superfamily hydrolase (TIGR01509 family)
LTIAAVILDFDGLILDTESPIYEEWRDEFGARGHVLQMSDWQRALGSHGAYDPCTHLHELCGGSFEMDALRLTLRERIMRRCDTQELLPGVRDLLTDAAATGLRRAVASSSSSAWVEGWLARHDLAPLVETVCTRDHVERVKPEPDLFLLAASRLGVDPASCVVFEDSPNGVRAARAAGMRCVAVPNGVTRGLSFDSPDLVVESLADHALPRLLDLLNGPT